MDTKIKTIEEVAKENKKTNFLKVKLIWSSWSINKKLLFINPFILIISIIIFFCPINGTIKLIFIFNYKNFLKIQIKN